MQNYNSKLKGKNTFAFLLVLLIFTFYLLPLYKVNAATMTNDNYTVQKRAAQIQPFVTERPKPKEHVEKFLASGDNYTVNTTHDEAFSFSTSLNTISFGELQPTNPVIRELLLNLISPGGYQIFTAATSPLQKQKGIFIPDTTCDNGSCSEITAAPWSNTLTYGFGYQTGHMEKDYYRQFADISRHEAFQAINKGFKTENLEEKITLKINTSGTQETGSYSNTIFYLATPDF